MARVRYFSYTLLTPTASHDILLVYTRRKQLRVDCVSGKQYYLETYVTTKPDSHYFSRESIYIYRVNRTTENDSHTQQYPKKLSFLQARCTQDKNRETQQKL